MAIGFKFFFQSLRKFIISILYNFRASQKKNFVILKFPFLLRYFFRMIDEA